VPAALPSVPRHASSAATAADEDAPQPKPARRSRRSSVSAEAITQVQRRSTVEEVVVHEKTDAERANIDECLRQIFLFKEIEASAMSRLIDACAKKSYAKGEEVITQGDDVADFFYIVGSGAAQVVVDGSQTGEPIMAGGFFGELALMYSQPRAATVTVVSDSLEVWAVDRATFQSCTISMAQDSLSEIEAFVSKVPLLASLTAAERSKLVDALQYQTFADGEAIIKQGDEGDAFYIVETGRAVAMKAPFVGVGVVEEQVGEPYEPGTYFGELALLNNVPRAASVYAHGW